MNRQYSILGGSFIARTWSSLILMTMFSTSQIYTYHDDMRIFEPTKLGLLYG